MIGAVGKVARTVARGTNTFRSLRLPIFRQASSLVKGFDEMVSSLPMREAVRYTDKNMKWTASEMRIPGNIDICYHYTYINSHANALLEHGFQQGDTIALWLPDIAEKHITLLAAAKMGLKVVDFSPSVSDIKQLRDLLASSACKAIIFEPVSKTQDNLLLLRKAIPELFYYDDTYGQLFHSKHFPSLKYFIHTGFDIEMGCLNYKSMFLHHPEKSDIEQVSNSTRDDMPLYARAGSDNFFNQTDVLKQPEWSFAKKLIAKEYFETN